MLAEVMTLSLTCPWRTSCPSSSLLTCEYCALVPGLTLMVLLWYVTDNSRDSALGYARRRGENGWNDSNPHKRQKHAAHARMH